VVKVGLIAVVGGTLLGAIGFKIIGPVIDIIGTLFLLAYALMRAGDINYD
jgi:hypothetical protein